MPAQWCLCGAEAGYPHASDCPRPLYRAGGEQAERWRVERQKVRDAEHKCPCGIQDRPTGDTPDTGEY